MSIRNFMLTLGSVLCVLLFLGRTAYTDLSPAENDGLSEEDCCVIQPLDFSTGPLDGRTGAPGELTCNDAGCHNSFALNSGDGALSISTPAQYSAGETIHVAINLNDPGQSRWGFELTALDASDNPVGQFVITDATRTQSHTDLGTGRTYIKHTLAGTDGGTSDAAPGWSVDWTAPDPTVGTITFYAAGNAANNNGTNLGDYIYTTSSDVTVSSSGCCDKPGDFNNDGTYNIADVTSGISYIFSGGTGPGCAQEADFNGDGSYNIADVTAGISYIFSGGAGPICGP